MPSGAGTAAVVAGLALTVGVGVLAYTLTRPTSCTSTAGCPTGQVCVNGQCVSSSPTCTCASPDVCPTKGVCPSGYETDPSNSACCSPTTSGAAFIFEISGNVGNIILDCPCDNTSPDLILQVSGATPNGKIAFFLGPSLSELYTLTTLTSSGSGEAPVTGTADAFGNLSLPVYSCALYSSNGVSCPPLGIPTTFGLCPFCGGCPCDVTATLYLQAEDMATTTYSDVISAGSTCTSCSGSTCCNQIL